MADTDLASMKTSEVAEKARQRGIDTSGMNKEEMIKAMGKGRDESSRPGHGGGPGDTPAPKGSDPSEWKNIPGNQS